MGGSLTEARKRLPSLDDLEQAAALLSIPGLDDADRNTGAPLHLRQAALLDAIASWAVLSARAAREAGDLDPGRAERYAYLIETTDEQDSNWWQAEGDAGGGIEESPDSAGTYALAVLKRYLDHLRAHLDDHEHVIEGELHVRVSVWPVASVTAVHASAPDPDSCPSARYGHMLKVARISPHAVEVRTPSQVRQHVYDNGVAV